MRPLSPSNIKQDTYKQAHYDNEYGRLDMPKNSEPHPLTSTRCKRLVRPLLSKIHSLTDLHSKYPAKFVFDIQQFTCGGIEDAQFTKPASAQDRLESLKPFLALETYDAYVEILNIIKNIVATISSGVLNGGRMGKGQHGNSYTEEKESSPFTSKRVPRLSLLAAQKMGKSIALGTKSTYYPLNQTALFDPESIPLYLRKYHDQLAEEIDEWLMMEPASVLAQHRSQLLLGYVMHILVFNLHTILYTLMPVLCHWLHEQNLLCLRTLFIEFWLFLHLDPDHEEVQELTTTDESVDPSLDTFWLFHKIGYWQQLVSLLGVRSSEFNSGDAYNALLLDALVCSDRLHLTHIDVHEIYALMRTNLQHPKNTQILAAILAQLIMSFQRSYNVASTSTEAHTLIFEAYFETRHFLQAWTCFRTTLIFNTLDRGNVEIFDACSMFIDHLNNNCSLVIAFLEDKRRVDYRNAERYNKFVNTHSKIVDLKGTCEVLRAFFLDTQLQSSVILDSASMVQYLATFIAEDYDNETLEIFMDWLNEQDRAHYGDFMASLQSQITFFQQ